MAAAGVLALGAASVGQAIEARNTAADYTPGDMFEPLAASSPSVGALDDPFVLPSGYDQQVVAQEPEGGTVDLWDMNTQNEFGKDAGRYVYRTHEVGPDDPSELATDDPRDNVAPFDDGVAVRPALGSKSHEGMRFDGRGYHYGISESNPGSVYRFVPEREGDLSEGVLQALRTENGRTGEGRWVTIPASAARTDAQAAATARGANGYNRPEDVETGESTGVDVNNSGNTLYVAMTGTDEVIAVDLSARNRPFAYQYVGAEVGNATPPEFDSPDNLALDRQGNLAITEDPGGIPPAKTMGDDIWIAEPQGGTRQPAGQGTVFDQFVSIAPVGDAE
jgi:hypothetical protein